MTNTDKTVYEETKYIAIVTGLLSLIMQIIFLILKRWNYTVLLGNLFVEILMITNFYLMGISVQKALNGERNNVMKIIKSSQRVRTSILFLAVIIGVIFPYFNPFAVVIPLFFTRIAINIRPLWENRRTKE